MASVSASTVMTTGVIRIPSYELLPTSILKGLEDAALAVLDSTSISGDLFNMSRTVRLPLAEVAADAVILIPLFATIDSSTIYS